MHGTDSGIMHVQEELISAFGCDQQKFLMVPLGQEIIVLTKYLFWNSITTLLIQWDGMAFGSLVKVIMLLMTLILELFRMDSVMGKGFKLELVPSLLGIIREVLKL